MVDRIVTFKLSYGCARQKEIPCYRTLSVVRDRQHRLSEAKVEEGMETRRIDGVVVLGRMAKQGAKRRSE